MYSLSPGESAELTARGEEFDPNCAVRDRHLGVEPLGLHEPL